MSFAKTSSEASSTESIAASSNNTNKVVDNTAVLSDDTSSSSESTNAADNRIRLVKLNEFLDVCGGTEPIGQAKKRWDALTSRSKKLRVDKATKVIVSSLDVIAPGDACGIWDAIQSSQSVEKSLEEYHSLPLTENILRQWRRPTYMPLPGILKDKC